MGEMLKHPKAEPDTVEEPPNGRLDLLGLSQPSTHSSLLPPKAVISATSYSMVLETSKITFTAYLGQSLNIEK